MVLTSCTSAAQQAQPTRPQGVYRLSRRTGGRHSAPCSAGRSIGHQTITNFKQFDQLFPVRIVRRGASALDLPNGEPIDPIVSLEDRRLTVDQLMNEDRARDIIALHHGRIVLKR